jgi:cell division protein FtsQ
VTLSLRRRAPWPRLLRTGLPLAVLLGATATLAFALQIRDVRVTGVRRFRTQEVTAVLDSALGTPTVAARAEQLRTRVRAIAWVADATVQVSLDGLVSCTVIERTPVALSCEARSCTLVDAEGRNLGAAEGALPALTLEGFAAHPEECAAVLGAAAELEQHWRGALEHVERLGPHDVALRFRDTPVSVLADPRTPGALADARAVLAAWTARAGRLPLRLDVRVPGRIAVLPAAPSEEAT